MSTEAREHTDARAKHAGRQYVDIKIRRRTQQDAREWLQWQIDLAS